MCVCVCVCVCVGTQTLACACARVALLLQHGTRLHTVICGLGLRHISRHYLIDGKILREKLLNVKCVFWFSLQILAKTFLILKRIQRNIVINVKTSLCKVPVILVGFQFSQEIFEKKTQI